MSRTVASARALSFLGLPLLGLVALSAYSGDKPVRPVKVKVEEEKAVVVEAELPVDPTEGVRFQPTGNFFLQINDISGQNLHLSHYPTFKIDGTATQPGIEGGMMPLKNTPLPKSKSGKVRKGYMNTFRNGDIEITQWVELAPGKTPVPGGKRQMDTVLIKYTLENKGTRPHSVGMRTYMDTYVIDNDQCLFATPNRPGKILDGVEFKGKDVPEYVQMLQRPDLKNPGYVAHMTLNLGGATEKPDSLILTRHQGSADNWTIMVIGGGGDSGLAVFYEPKELKPGQKREYAYTHGRGIGSPISAEGQFQVNFSGSFEIGKTFTISAMIADPAPGQSLELDLPKGLARVEGKHVQPVPETVGDSGYSMVVWKGRVEEMGRFPIRIKSSTGVTQTKVLTLSPG